MLLTSVAATAATHLPWLFLLLLSPCTVLSVRMHIICTQIISCCIIKDLKTCKHVHYALAGYVSVVVAAVVITVGTFCCFSVFFCLGHKSTLCCAAILECFAALHSSLQTEGGIVLDAVGEFKPPGPRIYLNPAVSQHTPGHIVLPSSQFSLFFSLYTDNHLYLIFVFFLRPIFSFYRNTVIQLFPNLGALSLFLFLIIHRDSPTCFLLTASLFLYPLQNFLYSVFTNSPYSFLLSNPPSVPFFYLYHLSFLLSSSCILFLLLLQQIPPPTTDPSLFSDYLSLPLTFLLQNNNRALLL